MSASTKSFLSRESPLSPALFFSCGRFYFYAHFISSRTGSALHNVFHIVFSFFFWRTFLLKHDIYLEMNRKWTVHVILMHFYYIFSSSSYANLPA